MPVGNIDFDRPFQLALRSTRLIGITSTGLGLVELIMYGFFNRLIQFRTYWELFASVVWLIPGVAFVLAAIMMKDRRRWAVIVAIATAAFQLIPAMALFIANFVYSPISPVPVLLSALWIAALIQLLLHLKQSLGSLHFIDGDRMRGFELIARQPLAALPIDQSSESDLGK